jgi:transcription termination factor Rho
MSTQELDRSMLDGKDREELHAIAGAMGVKAPTRMRKSELIDAILDAAEGGAPDTGGNGDQPADVVDPSSHPAAAGDADAAPSRPRTIRSARASELERDPVAALVADEEALPTADGSSIAEPAVSPRLGVAPDGDSGASTTTTETSSGEPDRTDTTAPPEYDDERASYGEGNARRRRRRRGRGGPEGETRPQESVGEPVEVNGLLELRDEGYGFLRTTGYLAGQRDVYVSASQVRRFALRKGDDIHGFSRPQASNEKYPALLRVDHINAMTPDEARVRPRFEDLTPLFPDERLRLELADNPLETTGRIVDLISPIGKGQRGLIVSPPKAGKTTILKQLVYSVERNNPEVHLIVLLVDERPEEVTDMRRHVVRGDVVSSTFDRPAEEHTIVADLAIERAKRLVELGTDVVVVLDGITRLARAYNLAAPASGRILSGGVDSTALYPPKKFFGAARNIEEGGSLTIMATALIETGSRMDEVIFEEFKGTGNMELRLDRRLAERRIYPAIDVEASSTRHEELLFERNQLNQVWKLRRVLNALDGDSSGGKGLELLLDKLRTTKSNDEFLAEVAKAPTLAG